MLLMELDLEKLTCCAEGCGIVYAAPTSWIRDRRNDHATFYCPNGHQQWFPGKSETEKLRDELLRERQKLDQAKADAEYQRNERARAERQASAARGQVTKLKRRASKGMCPCCNRYFGNLHRHMATQHPEFQGDAK